MAFTALLLLLLLGTGTCDIFTTESTTETTTTETTTTETTTTETTTTETTTVTTKTAIPSITIFRNASSIGTQTSVPSHATAFPATGNATANSTTVPVSRSAATSHTNATFGASAINSSSAVPTGVGTVIPITRAKENIPTRKTSATAQASTAARQSPTAEWGPNPSKTAALLPTAVQLLRRIPLSFHILNRSFNESLHDPTSKEYRSLSYAVLAMFEHVFACASCVGRWTYKGCSELRFSQGSVAVQSTLVFGHGNDTVTSDVAEQQLKNSLDQKGFVMGLQLASIQSTAEVMSPAPVPGVPDWAIALLVLVCILLLLSILTCLLMTTCTCRRKSRGKLDLLSTKDSYHPMAEYPPYQSHGRYVSPNSKPSPYSQVAGSNGGGTGTFTYTNPAPASDNL